MTDDTDLEGRPFYRPKRPPDIVERLRAWQSHKVPKEYLTEAADEIERLRKTLASDWIQGKNETIRENADAVIRRQGAEIERLRALEERNNRVRENVDGLLVTILSRDAENTRLRAALHEAACPGGGYNSQPKGEEPTVGNCLKAGVCGCSLGAALAY